MHLWLLQIEAVAESPTVEASKIEKQRQDKIPKNKVVGEMFNEFIHLHCFAYWDNLNFLSGEGSFPKAAGWECSRKKSKSE